MIEKKDLFQVDLNKFQRNSFIIFLFFENPLNHMNFFTFGPSSLWTPWLGSGMDQFFFPKFCYIIRIEHAKC